MPEIEISDFLGYQNARLLNAAGGSLFLGRYAADGEHKHQPYQY
jgi:hypothetical protein